MLTRIERNLLAQKFIQEIIYSKQSIKIALFYPQNEDSEAQNKIVPNKRDDAKIFSEAETKELAFKNKKFVSFNNGWGIKDSQTFNIILPNLIHKLRRRNPN